MTVLLTLVKGVQIQGTIVLRRGIPLVTRVMEDYLRVIFLKLVGFPYISDF